MATAKLEFNLPEEQTEFELAVNASKYHSVLWDLDQYLRGIVKYNSDVEQLSKADTCEIVRDYLHELMNDNGVKFD